MSASRFLPRILRRLAPRFGSFRRLMLLFAALVMAALPGFARAQVATFNPSNFGQLLDTDSNGNSHFAPDDPTLWAQSYTTGTDAKGDSYVAALSNWSTPSYPDSSSIEAVIGTNCELNQPGNTTVGSLDVQSAGSLEIDAFNSGGIANHAVSLTIAGDAFENDGTTVVHSSDQTAALIFTGTSTLSGTGLLTLINGHLATTGTGSLTNSTSIDGVGTISANMTNTGTITADQGGQELQIAASDADVAGTSNATFTNNGILAATGGATLLINGVALNQTTGTITALDGSTVDFESVGITGGTLSSAGSGVNFTQFGTSTLTNVTNTGTFGIGGNSAVVATGTLVDNGLIIVNNNNPAPSSSTLTFNGGTVSGTGTIDLHGAAWIEGSFAQGASNSIVGQGTIGAAWTNNGTLIANVGSQQIFLGGAVTNNGTLESANGATLVVNGTTIDQSGSGTITALDGSTVDFESVGITGGTLNTAGSGENFTQFGTSTLTNVTNTGTLGIGGNSAVVAVGTLVNNGLIIVNNNTPQPSNATLSFSGGTLTGAGSIDLNGSGPGAAIEGSFTQGASHTIYGAGAVGADWTNNGTLLASVGGSEIVISGAVTNNGLLEATNGATLELGGILITNAAGTIDADTNSVVLVDAGTDITGGTLSGSGTFLFNFGASTLSNLTNTGTVVVDDAGRNGILLDLEGTIVNNGTITHFNTPANSVIATSGGATLNGSGQVLLQGNNLDTVGLGILVNGPNHTVDGFGGLAAALTNDGTVSGNVSGKTLTLHASDPQLNVTPNGSPTFTNAGTFLATNSGTLALSNATVNQTGSGQIIADNGSFAFNGGGGVNGGTLSTLNSGNIVVFNGGNVLSNANTNASFYFYYGTLTMTSTTSGGTITMYGLSDLDIAGTFTNNGTIMATGLSASANGTLTGSGATNLFGGEVTSTNNAVFTNAQTFNGDSATIVSDFVNTGTMNSLYEPSVFSGAGIEVLSNNFDNYGAMNGGSAGLQFYGLNINNHAGARITGNIGESEDAESGTTTLPQITIVNAGTMSGNNLSFGFTGTFNNSGTFATTGPNGFLEIFAGPGQSIALNNTGTISMTGGSSGQISLELSTPWTNSGTIAIDSTSNLSIITGGEAAFGDGSALDVELGDGTLCGLLGISGTGLDLAHMNSLNITMAPGATFEGPYIIVDYPASRMGPSLLNGMFDLVTPGYTVDYSTPGEIIITAFTPEPASAALLWAGMGGLLARRGRRRAGRRAAPTRPLRS